MFTFFNIALKLSIGKQTNKGDAIGQSLKQSSYSEASIECINLKANKIKSVDVCWVSKLNDEKLVKARLQKFRVRM